MPALRWNDPLPRRPQRVLVAGCSGSGKSTLADQDHILRYGWSAHPRTRRRMQALLQEGTAPPVVRLRCPREVRAWLDGPVLAARGRSGP